MPRIRLPVHQPASPLLQNCQRGKFLPPSHSTIQRTNSLCRFRFRHVLIALLGNIPTPFPIVTRILVVIFIVLHYCRGWRFLEGMTLQLIRNSIITLTRERVRRSRGGTYSNNNEYVGPRTCPSPLYIAVTPEHTILLRSSTLDELLVIHRHMHEVGCGTSNGGYLFVGRSEEIFVIT